MKEKEPLEQAGQSEQQRKQATVLFVDIAGHTRLIHNLDPEENMEIIDSALVRLAEPVGLFGGHITRYQGDGFKAVFGLPMAQENDPERAVQAGSAILAGPHLSRTPFAVLFPSLPLRADSEGRRGPHL